MSIRHIEIVRGKNIRHAYATINEFFDKPYSQALRRIDISMDYASALKPGDKALLLLEDSGSKQRVALTFLAETE